MDDFEKLAKLIQTNFRLIAIETEQREAIMKGFREVSRHMQQAVYVWEQGKGLFRLEAPHIIIPNTKDATQVLKHIHMSKHPGIYLLAEFNEPANVNSNHDWIKSITNNSQVHKVVVLMDSQLEMPPALSSFALRTNYVANSQVA